MVRADWLKYQSDMAAQSVRGYAVEHEGEVIGLGCVVYTNPLQVVSYIDERLKKSPKTILKVARKLRGLLNTYDQELFALASEEEKNSDNFLEYVGFEFLQKTEQGRLYQWPQQHHS